MFTFALTLAVASSIFEMMIAAKFPAWRRAAHKSVIINLFGSMVLSYTMGIVFGAAGLIAMTAGLLSTMLSIPGYKILYIIYDSPQAQAHGGNLLGHYSEQWHLTKEKWNEPIRDLMTLVYKIIRLITLPLRILRTILITAHRWNQQYTAYKQRKTAVS